MLPDNPLVQMCSGWDEQIIKVASYYIQDHQAASIQQCINKTYNPNSAEKPHDLLSDLYYANFDRTVGQPWAREGSSRMPD
jgi:hypothetical protein